MYVLIFILHLPLETTYPLQLTIKGEIKGLQYQGIKTDQYLQGFYIRNANLTNGRPSWTHESIGRIVILFDDANEKWQVAVFKNGQHVSVLRSSTSPDNSVPHEAKNWEYHNQNNDKWYMSSDISIERGML